MIPRKAKKVTLEGRDCPRQTLGRRRHFMSKPVRDCEFSVRYVWNGARARLTKAISSLKCGINASQFPRIIRNFLLKEDLTKLSNCQNE